MSTDIEISVLLPTYNEATNVVLLIQKILEQIDLLKITGEIIVIDDNSPDKTAAAVQSAFEFENRIKVHSRTKKLGLGTAYLYGLQFATGKYILIMDADFSHEPTSISDFWTTLQEKKCDIVAGSRYIESGKIENWNWKRRLVSFVANSLTKMMLNVNSSDLTGSFRLYNKEVFKQCASFVQGKGYVFQMEILVHACRLKYKIVEVPIFFRERRSGYSKFCIREIWEFLKALFYLKNIVTES